MCSLLLVLAVLPLASFALTINCTEGTGSLPSNGTTSSKYKLQRTHQGDSFFE